MSSLVFIIDPFLPTTDVRTALELFAVPDEEIEVTDHLIRCTVYETHASHFLFDLGRVFAYLSIKANIHMLAGISSADAELESAHSVLNPFDWWEEGYKPEGHATDGNRELDGTIKPEGEGHEVDRVFVPDKLTSAPFREDTESWSPS